MDIGDVSLNGDLWLEMGMKYRSKRCEIKNSTTGKNWQQVGCFSEDGTILLLWKAREQIPNGSTRHWWASRFLVMDQACQSSTDQLYPGPLTNCGRAKLEIIVLIQFPFQWLIVQSIADNKIQSLSRHHKTLANNKQSNRLVRVI